MAKNNKNMFVYSSGIFGKYLLRGLVYAIENLIAFIGFVAIIVVFAAIGYALGISVPGIITAATVITAAAPILAPLVLFAIPLAAGEIIKKIYKDHLDWIVAGYKDFVTKLFTPKSFDISQEALAVKRAKHADDPNKATKYATPEAYVAAKKSEYENKNLDKKYPELDVAGRAGKRAFKAAATYVSNGLYWMATMPSRIYSAHIEPEIKLAGSNSKSTPTPD